MCLVGNDHGCGVKLPRLCCQLVHAVVGGETVGLIAVGMLFNNVEGLGAYGTC